MCVARFKRSKVGALSSTAIAHFVRLYFSICYTVAGSSEFAMRRHGISTKCTSPAYRTAFMKKAIRNLSKAFSFF